MRFVSRRTEEDSVDDVAGGRDAPRLSAALEPCKDQSGREDVYTPEHCASDWSGLEAFERVSDFGGKAIGEVMVVQVHLCESG